MKKIFIIFLFIIFSSSFSLAKNNEKITVEEIEDLFYPPINKAKKKLKKEKKIFDPLTGLSLTKREKEKMRSREKRQPYRGIAKCMNEGGGPRCRMPCSLTIDCRSTRLLN